MGPLPRPAVPVPLDVQTLNETRLGPIVRRKIAYHTDSPTRRVAAYLFLPAKPDGKVPAILCLHQTTKIGKDEPAGLGPNVDLQYALQLARRGYVTLAPDYPSFGEYAETFDPKEGYASGTMRAIYDNIRAIDLLQSLPRGRCRAHRLHRPFARRAQHDVHGRLRPADQGARLQLRLHAVPQVLRRQAGGLDQPPLHAADRHPLRQRSRTASPSTSPKSWPVSPREPFWPAHPSMTRISTSPASGT